MTLESQNQIIDTTVQEATADPRLLVKRATALATRHIIDPRIEARFKELGLLAEKAPKRTVRKAKRRSAEDTRIEAILASVEETAAVPVQS